MQMSNSSLKNKLESGQNVYGTCITTNAPNWPLIVKSAGLDFVFIDTEHIVLDRESVSAMCRIYTMAGISPIVRIRSADPFMACQMIDAGAVGVVAPYIESAEQARLLVGATKYRPLKGEILNQVLSGTYTLNPELATYLQNLNANNLCIVNIESVPALEKLEDILSVHGLDAVFIGPHDLSISLGIPEKYDHPDFEAAVKKIIYTARNKNLAVGIHFSLEPERQIRWIKEGANLIIHSSDMALFGQRLKQDMGIIKNATGDKGKSSSGEEPVI
ncbi:MAG: aldolase [Cyclobacteriaceae bacterium]|nr:aldolase [Cyclobacteriaceae bacterium]